MKYTQREVEAKISELTSILELKKRERKAINDSIKSISSQITKWTQLDQSQIKLL